jgi:hypothetical protein
VRCIECSSARGSNEKNRLVICSLEKSIQVYVEECISLTVGNAIMLALVAPLVATRQEEALWQEKILV